MILSALLTSVGINLGLCFLFFTLYSILRKQPGNITVYAPRLVAQNKSEQTNRFNIERLLPSADWVKQAWDPTGEDLLSLLGLDAVVFMHIFVFSLKVFAIAAVIGIAVLLPINYLGTQLTDDSDLVNKSLDSFSTQMSMMVLTVVCYFLYCVLEYWHISDKLISCFYSSKPLPRQFPAECLIKKDHADVSDPAINEFFDSLTTAYQDSSPTRSQYSSATDTHTSPLLATD